MFGKIAFWLVLGLVVAAALWGPIVSDVEQAKYTVVEKHDTIELRDYAPMLVAQVEVAGEREKAINEGFRLIADFIFGNNAPAQKVAMTAPVIQQKSETIAMTAPVIQQGEGGKWNVRFVMPSNYTMQTLPKPNNAAVQINEVPAKRFAVIRFSGMQNADNLQKNTDALNAFVAEKKLTVLSAITYAFYNPPWTLPFMRRNEVMVEVSK